MRCTLPVVVFERSGEARPRRGDPAWILGAGADNCNWKTTAPCLRRRRGRRIAGCHFPASNAPQALSIAFFTMRTSKVKAKLSRGEPVLVPALHFTDPSVYEMTSLMGFDCIWMDLEHHAYSVETAGHLMRAARVGGADLMARPAKGEFMRMGRLLEAVAQGIMYPRCDDADEARQVVRWAKFAPLGTRGFDGGNPDAPYGSMPMESYLREANAQTFLVVQIEDLQAVEQSRAIAEVEGVDVLFVGPADLSILSGVPGEFDHPRVQDAIRKVAEAAKRAGKD